MNMVYSEKIETFLHSVLEGFVDGILVLTDQKEIIYANRTAKQLCEKLRQRPGEQFPEGIWRVCQALLESRMLYPENLVTIESEVTHSNLTLHIRAQWLNLEATNQPCLLLRLQDKKQSSQSLAIAESYQWGLTPRETQVWLLRRGGHNRKEIAEELYISLDTVKKHLKNIQTKRQAAIDEAEWLSSQAS